jgi:hypothetical protein
MKRILPVLLLLLSAVACFAQKPAAKAPIPVLNPQPINSSVGTYYPLPSDVATRLRALQHKDDMLEVENQRMQVKIEQNRQQQLQVLFQMQSIAGDYATEKHIDLNLFQLDAGGDELKFIPKKKAQ